MCALSILFICRLIDEEQPATMSLNDDFGWKKYYDLDAIYGWLDQLVEKYPNVLTSYEYGKSYEGRPLRAVKVSHKKVRKTLIFKNDKRISIV